MDDEIKIVSQLDEIPEFLQSSLLSAPLQTFAACGSDTSDCSSDSGSCTSDVICANDTPSCTSDCTDCSDCSDCADCSDTPDASFWLDVSSTTVFVHVEVASGYTYYRIFYRKSSESTNSTINRTSSSDFTVTLSSLDANTTYLVRVYCATNTSAYNLGLYYNLGSQSITTGNIPITEEGYEVRIYNSSTQNWDLYEPYIYTSGGWKKYEVGIYDGSDWE